MWRGFPFSRPRKRAYAGRYSIASAVLALATALLPTAPCASPPTPETVGVRVEKPAGDGVHFSQGSGVLIGGGLVLSAAHVLRYNPQDPKVTVLMAGWRVEGRVVSLGGADTDLALVEVEDAAIPAALKGVQPVPVCSADPVVNQPMTVAAQGETGPAKAVTLPAKPAGEGTPTNLLTPAYHHGASGGGVFDAGQGCLAGIIVQEVSGYAAPNTPFVDLTVFVPASKIAAFLAQYRNTRQ